MPGKALYSKWIMEDVRHLVHILEDLPTCRPPIDHLLELLPRLQPRFYSIASSSKVGSPQNWLGLMSDINFMGVIRKLYTSYLQSVH